MQLNDYQEWSKTTAIYPQTRAIEYLALGLASEAGEVAGKVKKVIRDGGVDVMSLVDEVGDVFWYLVRICDTLGFSAEGILERNQEKLNDRLSRGKIGGSGDKR